MTTEFIPLVIVSFIAAFLGTVVMTAIQLLEIALTKRQSSYTPALAVAKVLRFNFERLNKTSKDTLNYLAHFAFGTIWGFPLAIFVLIGFVQFPAVLFAYFLIVWVQGWIVLSALSLAPPVWKWGARSIFIDGFHHLVYAFSTIFFFMYLL